MNFLESETFDLRPLASDISRTNHAPKILILHGSLREKSYSRLLAQEAGRVLTQMGAEVRHFDPTDLPVFDQASDQHPKVQELRALSVWSEGKFGHRQKCTVTSPV